MDVGKTDSVSIGLLYLANIKLDVLISRRHKLTWQQVKVRGVVLANARMGKALL